MKGSDAALKALASRELSKPKDGSSQAALGDAWWDRVAVESPAHKRLTQIRAAHWYWLAAPHLTEPAKTRVDRRVRALEPLVATILLPKQVINKIDGSILVLIPGGKFLAGDERFPVSLPPYYLGLHEVTRRQFKKNADAAGIPFNLRDSDQAAGWISWDSAKGYCEWAGLRLPGELEWEKGARGVDGREYPWGNEWGPECCANWTNRLKDPFPAICFPKGCSPWGLYQTSGNMTEWCADWFDPDAYKRYQRGDLASPASGTQRVLRSRHPGEAKPSYYRCTYRVGSPPESSTGFSGFRVAKSAIP